MGKGGGRPAAGSGGAAAPAGTEDRQAAAEQARSEFLCCSLCYLPARRCCCLVHWWAAVARAHARANDTHAVPLPGCWVALEWLMRGHHMMSTLALSSSVSVVGVRLLRGGTLSAFNLASQELPGEASLLRGPPRAEGRAFKDGRRTTQPACFFRRTGGWRCARFLTFSSSAHPVPARIMSFAVVGSEVLVPDGRTTYGTTDLLSLGEAGDGRGFAGIQSIADGAEFLRGALDKALGLLNGEE